jgi:hypothetical protein
MNNDDGWNTEAASIDIAITLQNHCQQRLRRKDATYTDFSQMETHICRDTCNLKTTVAKTRQALHNHTKRKVTNGETHNTKTDDVIYM